MTTHNLPRLVTNLKAIHYTVPSATTPGQSYTVTVDEFGWSCTCKAGSFSRPCWHQKAAKTGCAGEPSAIDADHIGHPRRIVTPARIGIADQSRPVSVDDLYA